ncbi:MAG: ATP-binding protein [Candidatus Natronoplasma sp.]
MKEEIKIMFVDIEKHVLEQVKRILKNKGENIDITTAPSVEEALMALENNDFQFVVLNHKYRKDGLELFKEIKSEKNKETPVLMFLDDEDETVVMKDLNQDEYFLENKKDTVTSIFKKYDEGAYICDASGNIKYTNRAFADLHGYTRDELIGKDIPDLLTEGSREKFCGKDIKNLEGKWHQVETETKDGDKNVLQNLVSFLGEEQIFGIIQDVTEQTEGKQQIKESKKKLTKLHQFSAELETCQTEDEIYSLAVEAAEDILEFDMCAINRPEGEEMKGVIFSSDFPYEASSIDKPLPIHDSMAGKTYQENRSFLVDDKENNDVVNPTSKDFRSGISVPIGDFAVFQAVSTEPEHFDDEDLKMTELLIDHVTEALKRLEVEESEKLLHSLLSHEVTNKVNLVDGYFSLLESFDLPEGAEKYVEKGKTMNKDIMKLIEKIEALRRIGEEEENKKMSLGKTIENVMAENKGFASEKDIEIVNDIDSGEVYGGTLLEELFSNILENSIKHSNSEKINISSKKNDGMYVISIDDDGKGISDQDKEKIFEKGFKKGENSGSGLGMYLVKRITNMYGGRIEVKDSELGGARFDVYLKKAD